MKVTPTFIQTLKFILDQHRTYWSRLRNYHDFVYHNSCKTQACVDLKTVSTSPKAIQCNTSIDVAFSCKAFFYLKECQLKDLAYSSRLSKLFWFFMQNQKLCKIQTPVDLKIVSTSPKAIQCNTSIDIAFSYKPFSLFKKLLVQRSGILIEASEIILSFRAKSKPLQNSSVCWFENCINISEGISTARQALM